MLITPNNRQIFDGCFSFARKPKNFNGMLAQILEAHENRNRNHHTWHSSFLRHCSVLYR